jgi:hypothetical protein
MRQPVRAPSGNCASPDAGRDDLTWPAGSLVSMRIGQRSWLQSRWTMRSIQGFDWDCQAMVTYVQHGHALAKPLVHAPVASTLCYQGASALANHAEEQSETISPVARWRPARRQVT